MAGPWEKYQNRGGPTVLPAAPAQRYEAPRIRGQIDNTAAQTGKTIADTEGKNIGNQFDRATMEARIKQERAAAAKAQADAIAAQRAATKIDRPDTMRAEAIKGWNAAREVDALLPQIERAYEAGPGATSGWRGVGDFIPTPENQAFDSLSNQLRAPLKSLLGFQGGDTNAAAEAAMNVGPFIPDSWKYDKTNKGTLAALRKKTEAARNRSVMQLGGVPDSNGDVTPIPDGYVWGKYPELDQIVGTRIDTVDPQYRQAFMVQAFRALEASPPKKRGSRSSQRPAQSGANVVVNWDDLP